MRNTKIVAAIAALCEAFNRTASEATYAAYELGLSGLTPAQVENAAALALQRCRFMPVPAELREFALAGGRSFEAMAEQAFETLRRAVRTSGGDYSVNFADGGINAAVRLLGGWQRVCELPREQFDVWLRRDFLAAYINLCRNGCPQEMMGYLVGNLERANARWEGHELPNGETYSATRYGAAVRQIGAAYPPSLPSPEVEPKRIAVTQDFLRPSIAPATPCVKRLQDSSIKSTVAATAEETAF
jgi:hypothetical protein